MSLLMPGHAPLQFHPLANLFPMLTEAELGELAADIDRNGQVETVKLHRGMILDGRNRYTACVRAGIGVRTELFTGSEREALDWVISKNLRRRHLTESQRAMVAAKLATLKAGDNQHRGAARDEVPPIGGTDLAGEMPPPAPIVSQDDAAKLLNVSQRSIQRASAVEEKGAAELKEAVTKGEIAVSVAADIAALPVEQQRAIVAAADPKVIKQVAKQQRAEKQKAGREKRLEKMRAPDATPLLAKGEKVGVLYVDIPRDWTAWSDDSGMERSPENHYRTESFAALAAMRDDILARCKDDCVIFMWAWAASLLDQLDLLAEWGFARLRRRDEQGRLLRDAAGAILPPSGEGRYRSHMIWAKRDAAGAYDQGLGFWVRDVHELLLIGARGDVPAPLPGMQALSIVDALKTAHSAKPAEFRNLIDNYFPGVRKLELFGRVEDPDAFKAAHPDWEVWGNGVAPAAPADAAAIEDSDGDDDQERAA